MGTLRIGTECSGICALSAALDRLQIDVDYAFACECDVHCQKQLRALSVPPKVIYENMETRDAVARGGQRRSAPPPSDSKTSSPSAS